MDIVIWLWNAFLIIVLVLLILFVLMMLIIFIWGAVYAVFGGGKDAKKRSQKKQGV